MSFATVLTQNMELTPCRVTFKGVDLGGTLDNVVIRPSFSKAEIMADQSGTTVRDRRVSGLNIQVETSLAEVINKNLWKVVFPHAKLVTSGLNKIMYFENNVGNSDLSNAGILQLHPLSMPDANLATDHKFFRACASAESEYTLSPTEQGKLKIVWNILPDDSVQPERFYIYGDPSVGLVAAVAAAPVYAGTGNGTMTGVVANSGVTYTETITVTCVTAVANAGVFSVTGSLSGALGLATVGVGFSPIAPDPVVISFLINDGATDFIVGDQFTIATTAANYV